MQKPSFIIPFNKDTQYLEVCIFKNEEEYHKATRHFFDHDNHIACYLEIYRGKGQKGLFGRLYFPKNWIGGGTVAHEITHFIFDWMKRNKIRYTDKNNEIVAQLADHVTKVFWIEFYKFKKRQWYEAFKIKRWWRVRRTHKVA